MGRPSAIVAFVTAQKPAEPKDPLDALRDELRTFVAEREWQPFHDPKNLSMAVASEAGATVQREGREVEIGVARYVVTPGSESCEFAIAVDDAWQGTGVAGILMLELMAVARSKGLKTMVGFVLSSNHKMLKFCHQLGFECHRELGEGDTISVVKNL